MSNLEKGGSRETIRRLMHKAEGTKWSLAKLSEWAAAQQPPPEAYGHRWFEQLAPELQWALLLEAAGFQGFRDARGAPVFKLRFALSLVTDQAYDELEAHRGLEADVEAEVEADEERRRWDASLDYDPEPIGIGDIDPIDSDV